MREGRDSGWSLPSTLQTVAFGVPIADALPEAALRLSARRLAIVTTNSLAGSGGLAEVVRNILDQSSTLSWPAFILILRAQMSCA